MATLAKMHEMSLVVVLVFSIFGHLTNAKEKSLAITLSEENWTEMLEGEWLVKFYAPWCPACKNMEPIWEKVAGWSEDLDINVADVDVTENPGLSGRFFVTALPTLYHVLDGEFRLYRGPRSEDELVSFVDDKRWKELDPVPWYSSPKSYHMGVLSLLFKASMSIRDLHNSMTTEFGIPVWGSYVIFALATILVGLLLGLIFVCLCDAVFPPRLQPESPSDKAYYSQQKNRNVRNPDDIPDNESDIVDDASHEPAGSQLIDNEEVKDDGKEEASGGAARKRVIQATTD